MVVKEDVVKCFSKLHANKRIELVCTLLNMCTPFELRFFGTCIEELGKRDFNELRDTENKANTCSEVEKISDLNSPSTRRKLLLYLALLHSSNYACSRIFYELLSNYQNLSQLHLEQPDLDRLDELLVLYTMALNHPAFTVEQKDGLTEPYHKLVQWEALLVEYLHTHTYQFCQQNNAKPSHVNNVSQPFHASELPDQYENQETSEGSEPNSCSSSQCSHSSSLATVSSEESPSPEVHISQLELIGAHRCRDRKYEYVAKVSWSNGDSNNVTFTQTQLYDFHHKLIELFAAEAGAPRSQRCLPYLHLSRESNDSNEEAVKTYLQQLAERCPMHIRLAPHVINFFKLPGGVLESAPSMPSSQIPKPGVCVIQGSSAESTDASRFTTQSWAALTASPPPPINRYPPGFTKPPTSLATAAPQRPPMKPSSYVKGNENESRRTKPTSRDAQVLQDILKTEHLQKYWESLHKYSLNELKTMTDEEFRKKGLSNGAVGKLKKVLHNMPNGLTHDQKRVQVSSMVASPVMVSGANTMQLVYSQPPPVYPTTLSMRPLSYVRPPFQACFSPTFLAGVTPARFRRNSPEIQDGVVGVKSNGSSPSCSEYSSPPGSPHLHSDTSTSNDDLENKDAALRKKHGEVPLIKKSQRERGSTSPEERSPLPASNKVDEAGGPCVRPLLIPPPTSWPRPLIRPPYNIHPVESLPNATVIKDDPKDHPVPSYPPPPPDTPSSPPPYPMSHNFFSVPGGPPLIGGFPGMIPTTNGFLSMPPSIGFAPNGLSADVMYGNGAHFSVLAPPTQPAPNTPNHFLSFHPPYIAVSPQVTQPKKISCYNCGGSGHRGNECKEPTFDDVTKTGYRINYNPSPKPEKTADL